MLEAAIEVVAEMQLTAEELKVCRESPLKVLWWLHIFFCVLILDDLWLTAHLILCPA